MKSANVFEEDDVEEERLISTTSSPMKFVSAREASVLSMKASVLFQAYASASKERTTSMDADDAGAAVTVAIDSGDDVEEFSPPSNCMELVCMLVIASLMLLLDGIISLFSSLLFSLEVSLRHMPGTISLAHFAKIPFDSTPISSANSASTPSKVVSTIPLRCFNIVRFVSS